MLALVHAASSVAGAGPPHAQEDSTPTIVQREVRLTRDMSGVYRVLEAIDLRLGSGSPLDSTLEASDLTLLRLQDVAGAVLGMGGDLPATAVRFDSPDVIVTGVPTARELVQIILSYELPAIADRLVLTGAFPTEQLAISIARGNIEARADSRLAPAGLAGSVSRPRLRYLAHALPADSPVVIELRRSRITWRDRLATLIATSVAVALACVWAWRWRRAAGGG